MDTVFRRARQCLSQRIKKRDLLENPDECKCNWRRHLKGRNFEEHEISDALECGEKCNTKGYEYSFHSFRLIAKF